MVTRDPIEPTPGSPAVGTAQRLHVHNRTDVPLRVSVSTAPGQDAPLTESVRSGTTFVWELRIDGPFDVVADTDAGRLATVPTRFDELCPELHLVVDQRGATLYDPATRKGPDQANGIQRVQVGCGPHNLFVDWWNVDIRDFPGVDAVMDVTKEWPYRDLQAVYGEHFIEHLDLGGAVDFLVAAGRSLRRDGVIRLTTPNLEWVVRSHFPLENGSARRQGTLAINRAFHGWGHRFLYSREFMEYLLASLGFRDVQFFDYGRSGRPELRNLERHGGFGHGAGVPNLLVVEAVPGASVAASDDLQTALDDSFGKYVAGGH